jgi:hypothetical protein
MATPVLRVALWNLIEPLFPTTKPNPQGGRPRLSDRACLQDVLFSAQRDSLSDVAAGDELWFRDELLAKIARLARGRHLATDPLRLAGLARALWADRLVTGSRGRQFRASGFWGLRQGLIQATGAKLGSKRHLISNGRGIPPAIQLTGANRNDSQ